MDKNQALAAMDAHLVRVEAERNRRTERRQRGILRFYPALKAALPSQREGLLHEARRYAFTHWSLYASLGLCLAVAAFLLREQLANTAFDAPPSTVIALIVLALVPAAVLYFQMRGYLQLAVGARNQEEGALPP